MSLFALVTYPSPCNHTDLLYELPNATDLSPTLSLWITTFPKLILIILIEVILSNVYTMKFSLLDAHNNCHMAQKWWFKLFLQRKYDNFLVPHRWRRFFVLMSDYQLLKTHPAPCNFMNSLLHFIQLVLVDNDLLLG
jgi:hypothetical protein